MVNNIQKKKLFWKFDVHFRDTAGQERFRAVTRKFFFRIFSSFFVCNILPFFKDHITVEQPVL